MKTVLAIVLLAAAFSASGMRAAVVPAEISVEAHGLSVRAHGVGQDAFADVKTVMEEQTALTEDKSVTPPLADDLAFFVRQRYLELGYREAAVIWKIEGEAVILDVTEGPRYKVGIITYEGAASQDEHELTKYLLRPTHEKLNTTGKSPPFVEADLRAGAGLVERYLQAQGFFTAAVSEPVATFHSESGTADVLLHVEPGLCYQIGEITVTGELEGADRAVWKQLDELRGQIFSEVDIDAKRKALTGIYQERGHFNATVTARADPTLQDDGVVPVEYHVVPGPRFRIASIEIGPGFSAGARRLIRACFKPAEGRIDSPEELDVMHRRLLDTEVFARVELKPKPGEDDTLTLELTGDEAKRTTLAAYAGYESFQGGILGTELRQVNFMDSGNAVRLKAEINARGLDGGIKVLDPAIFNSPFSLDVELAAQSFKVFEYERRTLRVRSTLARQWDRHITTSVFGEISANKTESDTLNPVELGPDEYRLGTVGASITLDYRDSPVLPTKGWFASAAVTSSVGGDVRFLRSDVAFAYYQPLTKRLRAAIGGHASAIDSEGGRDAVPIDLRLFNGGATSVRSFAERRMGDQSKGETPLGGTLSHVVSAELSYEVIRSLELAVFADVGALSPVRNHLLVAPSDLRYAIGLGLRYKLPIGPLRADFGFNPQRRPGEAIGALHITFGFAF